MHWRERNSRLQLKRKPERKGPRPWRRLIFLAGLAVLVWLGFKYGPALWALARSAGRPAEAVKPEIVVVTKKKPVSAPEEELDKKHLADIIGDKQFQPDEIHSFKIKDEAGNYLYVRTTLEPGLQAWALKFLPQTIAVASALVAMDPRTGEVLCLASHRSDGRPVNVALSGSLPAASLFKIVTAAAAVEKKDLKSSSTLAYDGRKHTLYKKQLDKNIKDGQHQVTLKEGFADSINTVFGKLGAFTLGRKELEAFARKFHFNQPIEFELPVQKSQFAAPDQDDPYRLAELASGFNRTTTVSPLHGAMLASAIVNDGRLMEPTVVREVFDLDNHIFYRHEPVSLGQVVSTATVQELQKMMRATVTEGTGRRNFGDAGRHPILKRLDLGGKSGSINDDDGRRVDWFVGFARRSAEAETLALAAVVVHGEKLGLRSQEIVREAVLQYFRPRMKEDKS
ncbi:MAG: penicillin-binding transpeptidase domain-containing protein [Thermodesulfobacteriota bacterium]